MGLRLFRLNDCALTGRKMPVLAKRTKVRFTLSFDPHHSGGVERVALRSITAFADAHALPFFTSGFFHGSG